MEFLCVVRSLSFPRRLANPFREDEVARCCLFLHPAALWKIHDDPRDFPAALDLQIRRHGENSHHLHRAIVSASGLTDRTTLAAWRRGLKASQTAAASGGNKFLFCSSTVR